MSNYSNKTLELTRLALLIAMNCVSAYIVIPLPFSLSPIVLQTLVVNLVAFLLSPKQAFHLHMPLIYLQLHTLLVHLQKIQELKNLSANVAFLILKNF